MGLLATAKSLQIKGLTDASDEISSTPDKRVKTFKTSKSKANQKNSKKRANDDSISHDRASKVPREAAERVHVKNETLDEASDEEPMPPRRIHTSNPYEEGRQEEEEGYVEEYGGEDFDEGDEEEDEPETEVRS